MTNNFLRLVGWYDVDDWWQKKPDGFFSSPSFSPVVSTSYWKVVQKALDKEDRQELRLSGTVFQAHPVYRKREGYTGNKMFLWAG